MADILHKPPWLFYEEDEKIHNRPSRPLTFIEVMWGLYLLYAVIKLSKYDVPILQRLRRLKGFNMTWSIGPILELGFKSSQSDCKTHYFSTVWI